MTTTSDPYAAGSRETTEGRVYTVTGGDWDLALGDLQGEERLVVNMGPQHPSTHGVLRLILEIDGETVTEARCGIGYLHTGIEKNMEYRSWTTTRCASSCSAVCRASTISTAAARWRRRTDRGCTSSTT